MSRVIVLAVFQIPPVPVRQEECVSVLRLITSLCLLSLLSPVALLAQRVPDRLSDSTFWGLFRGLSETTGSFASENFTSNESGAQWVLPIARAIVPSGRAYLGVGPEQNFTYIAAFAPQVAFLLDIRSQAATQHLLYKALFELAPDRAAFLALLFSRTLPVGVDSASSVSALMDAIRRAPPDLARFEATLQQVLDHLEETHGFTLTPAERADLNHIFQVTFLAGPRLNYNAGRLIPRTQQGEQQGLSRLRMHVRRRGAQLDTTWYRIRTSAHGWMDSVPVQTLWADPVRRSETLTVAGDSVALLPRPISEAAIPPATSGVDFIALMVQEDSLGVPQGFLASEAHYQRVRDLHLRNLIIPVVGDFAGPTALRAIAAQLHAWQLPLGAFYTSNVEEYLFPTTAWTRFYANLATLPHDEHSLMLRAFLGERILARRPPGVRVDLALGSVSSLLEAVRLGRVTVYADLIPLSDR